MTRSFYGRSFLLLIFLLNFVTIDALESENKSEEIFTPIFGIHPIQDFESLSGEGSTLENTRIIRREIPLILQAYNCKTILDLPCGDFHWMKTIDLRVTQYFGADCIKALVVQNQKLFGNQQRVFLHLDAVSAILPTVDLVLTRDMLVHLSNKNIFSFLRNLKKSGSKYFLTTHFTDFRPNQDTFTGGWRSLNFTLPPFNFPKPLLIINEEYTGYNREFCDKSLALWEIKDLPEF